MKRFLCSGLGIYIQLLNKTVAHEAIAECVTVVLTTFSPLLWSITKQTHGNMESICFTYMIIKKQNQKLMTSNLVPRKMREPGNKVEWRHLYVCSQLMIISKNQSKFKNNLAYYIRNGGAGGGAKNTKIIILQISTDPLQVSASVAYL